MSSRGGSVDPLVDLRCRRVRGLRRWRDGPVHPCLRRWSPLCWRRRGACWREEGDGEPNPLASSFFGLHRGTSSTLRLRRLAPTPAGPPSSSSAAASLHQRLLLRPPSPVVLRLSNAAPSLCSRTVENGPTELPAWRHVHREATTACGRGRTREWGRHGRRGRCREGGSARRRRLRVIPLVKHTERRAADCERDNEVMQIPILLEWGFVWFFYFLPIQNVLESLLELLLWCHQCPFFLLFLSNQSDPQSDVTHHDVPKITKD
jgi:hypothetical protein